MKRQRLSKRGGAYFRPSPTLVGWTSGCRLLDCVLGGHGWVLGRVVNVVGDKSTGKTLLAIEACANFAETFRGAAIRYREVEAAFDKSYAAVLGLPVDRVEFPKESCFTVEDVFADMENFITEVGKDKGLYVLDSLDAVSDKAELEAEFGKATYGTGKARDMSKLFRMLAQRLEHSKITVFIVSQTRDRIGKTFGRKTTRSGGRALDFYASQVLWLSQLRRLTRKRRGVKRAVGICVRAFCDKNKVGLPFRECSFPLLFSYGVDDVAAALDWLDDLGKLPAFLEVKDTEKALGKGRRLYERDLVDMSYEDFVAARKELGDFVQEEWEELERDFAPGRRKYGEA